MEIAEEVVNDRLDVLGDRVSLDVVVAGGEHEGTEFFEEALTGRFLSFKNVIEVLLGDFRQLVLRL